ncbi:hypothetical protein Pint_31159 [Pistacia integerrima]|uniref:Uncharacterized protein n=1 Tax=Pistacia integerrima TaxID=434235 RepID=A0ACC0XLS6_9ROSI|nr:hypothetical protein Pint_31159 [Pistacia integerrima]
MLEITHEFTRFHCGFLGIENFEERNYLRVKHLVHFLRICMVPSKLPNEVRSKILTTPNVSKLHKIGVKFKLGSTANLFDIKFRDEILEIPRLSICSPMEYVVKNLLAFEQSQCDDNLLCDYVIFMNYLVHTPKDVELFVRQGIIENLLGDSEQVPTLFHKLVEQATFDSYYFQFSSVVEDLNAYCRRPWNKWKANLKQDILRTPWTAISVIFVVILLYLYSL